MKWLSSKSFGFVHLEQEQTEGQLLTGLFGTECGERRFIMSQSQHLVPESNQRIRRIIGAKVMRELFRNLQIPIQ
jgi:hypothetical protein